MTRPTLAQLSAWTFVFCLVVNTLTTLVNVWLFVFRGQQLSSVVGACATSGVLVAMPMMRRLTQRRLDRYDAEIRGLRAQAGIAEAMYQRVKHGDGILVEADEPGRTM